MTLLKDLMGRGSFVRAIHTPRHRGEKDGAAIDSLLLPN